MVCWDVGHDAGSLTSEVLGSQNINILTIGSPDGIGGFFPKVTPPRLRKSVQLMVVMPAQLLP